MKLLISILIFLNIATSLGSPILIQYTSHFFQAKTVKKVIQIQMNIPSSLIELKHIGKTCSKKKRNKVLNVCLDHEKRLRIIEANSFLINNAYRIFRTELKQ